MDSLKLMLCNPDDSDVMQTGITEFQNALLEKDIRYELVPSLKCGKAGAWTVVIGTVSDYRVKVLLEGNAKHMPVKPESLGCFRINTRDEEVVLLAGSDDAGLLYLLLEMARRIRLYGINAITDAKEFVESPENQVRCMDRYLLGHLDNEWFLSEDFFQYYFLRLAYARFNRFSLILGFDTAYMSPPYPFFLPVNGFEAVDLTDRAVASREENLNALRTMVDLCHRHGMKFVLATWQQRPWTSEQESLVKNLPESEKELSDYCYAGIVELLKAVPGIDIVQFRVNHESGVGTQVSAEDFWNHCADAVAEAGRQTGKRFMLDLRAKGLTEAMVDHAMSLGLDVEVPTKYWCEHAALPYHLSIMRSEELAQLGNYNHSRRYSYADMLQKPKKYDVIFRLWNYGSTNLFLWGDADYARRFSKSCSLSGSTGYQVNAPLSLKYGHELSHQAPWKIFRDDTLNQARWEEERFWLWYTLYGRLGYNSNTDAEVWESEFSRRFGDQGMLMEKALATASRIVPLITTVHMPVHPSLRYWTEMNTGWALFAENNLNKIAAYDFYESITYGSSEPSDHGLFYGIDEYAHDVFSENTAQGKYTPLQYAAWLEELSRETAGMVRCLREENEPQGEVRAALLDMEMVSHLGLYHAQKIRSAYALACYRETGRAAYLTKCESFLLKAMESWQALSEKGKREYYHDLNFSSAGSKTRRGTWGDLTIELEKDLGSVQGLLEKNGITKESVSDESAFDASALKTQELTAEFPDCAMAGQEIRIRAAVSGLVKSPVAPVLHYRCVNQLDGEFKTVPMDKEGDAFYAVIPKDQVTASWDMMAYVTLQQPGQACSMYPGIYNPRYPYPYAVIQTI